MIRQSVNRIALYKNYYYYYLCEVTIMRMLGCLGGCLCSRSDYQLKHLGSVCNIA